MEILITIFAGIFMVIGGAVFGALLLILLDVFFTWKKDPDSMNGIFKN